MDEPVQCSETKKNFFLLPKRRKNRHAKTPPSPRDRALVVAAEAVSQSVFCGSVLLCWCEGRYGGGARVVDCCCCCCAALTGKVRYT